MKIFWSWQSDTPGKTGRFLIRDALKDAIDRLKNVPDIEEPLRELLHLDQDIQNVPGSPDLARTIFGKIDASEVVVADVTLVGAVVVPTDAEKKLINSNVAIELGYALKAVSDGNVLLVFNKHYGAHEDLPFDLRHKGNAIVFNLPPEADRSSIDEEKKKLTDRFVSALKPYLQKAVAVPPAPFREAPSTFSKATYFEKDEVLGRAGQPCPNEVSYAYDTESLCYIRLIPVTPLPEPMRLPELRTAAQFAPLLAREYGLRIDLNTYGAIGILPGVYPSNGRAPIEASTQLFESGEIWSIGASLIKTEAGSLPIGTVPETAREQSASNSRRQTFAAGRLPRTMSFVARGDRQRLAEPRSQQVANYSPER